MGVIKALGTYFLSVDRVKLVTFWSFWRENDKVSGKITVFWSVTLVISGSLSENRYFITHKLWAVESQCLADIDLNEKSRVKLILIDKDHIWFTLIWVKSFYM